MVIKEIMKAIPNETIQKFVYNLNKHTTMSERSGSHFQGEMRKAQISLEKLEAHVMDMQRVLLRSVIDYQIGEY